MCDLAFELLLLFLFFHTTAVQVAPSTFLDKKGKTKKRFSVSRFEEKDFEKTIKIKQKLFFIVESIVSNKKQNFSSTF